MNPLATKEVGSTDDLWKRFCEGEEQAFNQLVLLYQPQIFKLAYGFFTDRDDALEIVQETFIRLVRKGGQLGKDAQESQVKSWLYRVAYNLCVDFYRKYRKKKMEDQDLFELMEGHPVGPEDTATHEETQKMLLANLSKLSNRQRRVFTLRHFSGLKIREIADVLGISTGTVKSLHHRALRGLQKGWRYEGGVK